MQVNFSESIKNARCLAVLSGIDSGTGPGMCLLYSGPKPSPGFPITTQTLLLKLNFEKPSGIISNGVLQFKISNTNVTGLNSGVAEWARLVNSESEFQVDLDVSMMNMLGAVRMDDIRVEAGSEIQLIASNFTEP